MVTGLYRDYVAFRRLHATVCRLVRILGYPFLAVGYAANAADCRPVLASFGHGFAKFKKNGKPEPD
jgi:hypothetical protein